MSTIDTRREQMFPKLEPREIDRLRRFGDVRRYSAGEALFVTGEIAPGMAVLIKGSVRVTRRDPLGHRAPIVEQGAGELVAEVGACFASNALGRFLLPGVPIASVDSRTNRGETPVPPSAPDTGARPFARCGPPP